MGSEIEVKSQLGEGSTFSFIVDLDVAEDLSEPTGDQPAPRKPKPSSARAPGRPARILIADDDRVNHAVFKQMIGILGHETAAVSNGKEAVDQAKDGGWDLILMDVQMPVMDGIEATKLLRGDPATRDLPIIAVTASIMAEEQDRYLKTGFNAVLAKPLRRAALKACLEEWLGTVDS